LGRQLRSQYTPGSSSDCVVIDSAYDPEVEFLEIKATCQGRAYWFVYGPDLTQRFGGLQGQGGLEAVLSDEGNAEGILSDAWGNALASLNGKGVRAHSMHLSGYGPEPTQLSSIFPWEKDWAKVFAWRGHRLETSGYYRMGVRPYDPSLASFLSPDPHGSPASANLYAYANGDPFNAYDPEGRSAYLLDGTWAHEEGMQNDPALTNAQRLHLNYVGPGESHYFRGVGNSKDNSWFAQYWGGVTGAGAKEIVEDAYREIVSNYNAGDRHIFIAGWSRGAAECMELAWTLYLRGIPNLKRGGYIVPPEQACPVIDQVHLMDMVHSMGVPGSDINRGWHVLDMPPNIYRTYHYLAGEIPNFGFRQTRPPSAHERAYCGVHGDIGGSLDTDCRRWVYRSIVEHANGHGLTVFDPESIEDYVDGDPSQRLLK
jgi:RHS repeat-associated protein